MPSTMFATEDGQIREGQETQTRRSHVPVGVAGRYFASMLSIGRVDSWSAISAEDERQGDHGGDPETGRAGFSNAPGRIQ